MYGHVIRGLLDGLYGVAHGAAHTGGTEHGDVVFLVSGGYGVCYGDIQQAAEPLQGGALMDPLGDDLQ